MSVAFMTNYYFSGRRRPHRQWSALGDRLCESKIKPAQFFEGAHKDSVYMCIHRVSDHTYIRIYVYIVFLKNN
jgi:hypothetical protein